MDTTKLKIHWDNVYETKNTSKVSWFQEFPETSLNIIEKLNQPKTAHIIDIGCGDSCLPNFLVNKGYLNISALDISATAIENSKAKMKENSNLINWIIADITNYTPNKTFSIWHDRAVFHFLTEEKDISQYVKTTSSSIDSEGFLILSTFSNNGPDQCSGLSVKQYSEEKLVDLFSSNFKKIECFTKNHQTPSGSSQNFIFCLFQKK